MCDGIARLAEGKLSLLSATLRLRAVGRAKVGAAETVCLTECISVSLHTERGEVFATAT